MEKQHLKRIRYCYDPPQIDISDIYDQPITFSQIHEMVKNEKQYPVKVMNSIETSITEMYTNPTQTKNMLIIHGYGGCGKTRRVNDTLEKLGILHECADMPLLLGGSYDFKNVIYHAAIKMCDKKFTILDNMEYDCMRTKSCIKAWCELTKQNENGETFVHFNNDDYKVNNKFIVISNNGPKHIFRNAPKDVRPDYNEITCCFTDVEVLAYASEFLEDLLNEEYCKDNITESELARIFNITYTIAKRREMPYGILRSNGTSFSGLSHNIYSWLCKKLKDKDFDTFIQSITKIIENE